MLRFPLGVKRMDKINTEYIRGRAQIERFDKVRGEAEMVWIYSEKR